MAFEDRLRDVISSAGCTIDQFARELDEPAQRLKDILRAKQRPPAEVLVKIHLMYGIDINWLLVGDRKLANKGEPLSELLQPRERELLRRFREADDAGKRFIESAAMRAGQPEAIENSGIVQSSSGAGAVMVGRVGRVGRVTNVKSGR